MRTGWYAASLGPQHLTDTMFPPSVGVRVPART